MSQQWIKFLLKNTEADISKGLQAQIADPLWVLSRQWQLGEFQGDDAGRPVQAAIHYKSIPLDQAGILDPHIESEDVVNGQLAIRTSAEAGLQFLRRLPADKRLSAIELLQPNYRFQNFVYSNLQDTPLLRQLVEKSFNAKIFYENPGPVNDSLLTLLRSGQPQTTQADLDTLINDWKTYCDRRFQNSNGSFWQKDRMEYKFNLSATQSQTERVSLQAEEYYGGQIDWHHFNIEKENSLTIPANETHNTVSCLPNPVRYVGMPSDRFWEFEEGKVFFGGIKGSASDLAQMILSEFATVYSNDWFLIPLAVDAGSLTSIFSLEVRDSFGIPYTIESAAKLDGEARNWRFFELTGDTSAESGRGPWLFVPDILASSQEDKPIEKVIFTRDESANIAWGIEEIIEGRGGQRLDRKAHWARFNLDLEKRLPQTPIPDKSDDWNYRLYSTMPPFWIPFIPEIKGDRSTHRLQRGRMAEWDDILNTSQQEIAGAQGVLLSPEAPLYIQEEEIPRGAIEISRSYQSTRDSDGNLYIWLGRKKKPSSGNRASGRETDQIEM